jgi:hypothetical protein
MTKRKIQEEYQISKDIEMKENGEKIQEREVEEQRCLEISP